MKNSTLVSTLVLNTVVNVIYLLMVRSLSHQLLPAALISGLDIVVLASVVVLSIRGNKRVDAKYTELLNEEVDEREKLLMKINKLNETGTAFVKAQAEIDSLKEKLETKERALEEKNSVAKSSQEAFLNQNEKLAKIAQQNHAKHQDIETMLSDLGVIASTVHGTAHSTITGNDLKALRYRVLKVAIKGFAAVGHFSWKNSSVDPNIYRDFIQTALGENIIDPRTEWASAMILAAHSKPMAEKPTA